jgi:translation initiation factor IF-2
MEQRRLRLGDILDDYCPRERRLTNHAVVAMIEEDVKQTRCTTCDAEHVYKGGKVPRRRKQETPAALYKEVLAGMPDTEGAPLLAASHLADAVSNGAAAPRDVAEEPPSIPVEAVAATVVPVAARQVVDAPAPAEAVGEAEPEPAGSDDVEDGPVHRPLIRAQLPRIEGHKEERRLPEFTIRQAGRGGTGGGFRGGDARMKQQRAGGPGGSGGNGNRSHGAPRFGGPRPAGGPGRGQPGRGGPSAGFRGAGQPRQGGPKKRSR